MPPRKTAASAAASEKAATRATASKPMTPLQWNRRVSNGLAALGMIALIAMYYGWELWLAPRIGLNRVHVHTMQDRLVLALRNQVPAVLSLMVSWLHVALTRALTAAANPLARHEGLVELPNRILTNTLEQVILSALNQLILATYLPEEKLRLLPLISATFLVGRVTFAAGYIMNPWWRSFGVVVTTVPTIGMTGYNVWWLATQGLTARLGSASRS